MYHESLCYVQKKTCKHTFASFHPASLPDVLNSNIFFTYFYLSYDVMKGSVLIESHRNGYIYFISEKI